MSNGIKRFPTELKLRKYEIERIAQKFGLSFPLIVYNLVSMEEMSEVVAYHGFPTIPHHWRYGEQSIKMKQHHKYGLGRVYEIVVLTRPMYGYLMDSNPLVTQASVMAHVCGHGDMFQNNSYNQLINPEMMNVFANDAIRYDEYCRLYGSERVKKLYDAILSVEWLVDPDSLVMRRMPRPPTEAEQHRIIEERKQIKRIEARDELPFYMDDFLNPLEWIEAQRKKIEAELGEASQIERGVKIPPRPVKDILLLLIQYAPLELWERDIVAIVRRYIYHIACFARTKFMHEGWSALWEERIMNEPSLMRCDLSIFAEQMAQVQYKSPMNPYEIACNIWLDIEYRWNTGRHGRIWEECDYNDIKNDWDKFIVYKDILTRFSNTNEFNRRWNEFLAFEAALKKGELGYPREFFVRNFYTSEILIPCWIDYQHANERYCNLNERLRRMEEIEENLEETIIELKQQSMEKAEIPDDEIAFEARRNIYAPLDAKNEILYRWTIPEIRREISYYEKLLAFSKKVQQEKTCIPGFYIPDSWYQYAKQFPDKVELGVGTKKMFEVRSYYDDHTFMEEFFTKDFCEKHDYFLTKQKTVWDWNAYPEQKKEHWFLETRAYERIRSWMLFQFTNFHMPIITVEDANYDGNRELYLRHHHIGVDLDYWSKNGRYVKDVLERIFRLWGGEKSVYLETIKTKKPEDHPWWFDWYNNKEKEGGDPQKLQGERVIFMWQKTGFSEKILESVTFQSPF